MPLCLLVFRYQLQEHLIHVGFIFKCEKSHNIFSTLILALLGQRVQ